jgi:hypothetical protein|tara:strand:- start:1941 stop:2282 length:342 start_codon:yes stop_codon:yes gene_type:complete
MSYAKATKALGICDRCGFTYKLNNLYYEIENSVRNGLRVCNNCFDKDNPQLKLGRLNIIDPQALYNARPDTGESASTRYSSFNPIGGGVTEFGSSTMGLTMNAKLGKITVSTS